MFTGIITDLGHVRSVEKASDTRFEFETAYDTTTIAIGASIACSGPCLTVIEKGPGWFAAMASTETLACTTMGEWKSGTPVNFERPLTAGDEFGGHMVSGHIDGVATVADRKLDGESIRLTFEAPSPLMPYIAPKGSVAIDGVSLTVNEVEENRFGINIILHTQEVTTFGAQQPANRVNLEIDQIARYVARLLGKDGDIG